MESGDSGGGLGENRRAEPGSTATTTPVASAVPWVFAFSMQAEQSIFVDPKSPGSINSPHGLILFDGVCVLCSRGCGFVSKRDRRGYFRFVPMQLAEERPLAGQLGILISRIPLRRLMTNKTKATLQVEEARENSIETPPDSPRLDLADAGIKKMIKQAEKSGYVTYELLHTVMHLEEVTSEKIEDILAMLNEMGINVVETEEAEADQKEPREEAAREEDEVESEGSEIVAVPSKPPARSGAKEPAEHTDDPVRIYLREMRSIVLLSREGEIAIAKRIEAGREAMIAGLCESPLTFQAVIIWRDELNDGKVFLRDIIDLEATYAGPDAKPGVDAPLDRARGDDPVPASRGSAGCRSALRPVGCNAVQAQTTGR